MSTRISSLLLATLAAGCGDRQPGNGASPGDATLRIDCAIGGAAAFARDCIAERAGNALIVHHPDGGFRRLLITADGRGVAAADGAQPARVTIVDGETIDVAIAGDRYRLPATVGGRARGR